MTKAVDVGGFEIAQDMYPVREMVWDIYPLKDFRPAYIYWAINDRTKDLVKNKVYFSGNWWRSN